MVLTVLNILFCLSFMLFAYFNLNDGDAALWVSIYMLVAISCGLAAFKKYFPEVYLVLFAVYIVYAIVLFFSKDGVQDWLFKYNRPSIAESMQATKPYIEKTREFFGLLIACAVLAMNYFTAK
jgi:uncharacterized membrane protein YfcA